MLAWLRGQMAKTAMLTGLVSRTRVRTKSILLLAPRIRRVRLLLNWLEHATRV